MEKNKSKNKKKLWVIITSLLLCLFCSFSFAGCMGSVGGSSSGGGSGGSGGSSSGGGSGGSSSGGSGSGGSSSGESGSGTTTQNNIDDYNDVYYGAIGVYEGNPDEKVYFDKYTQSKVSFNDLQYRQFSTMGTFLFNSINRIYGDGKINGSETNYYTTNLFGSTKTINVSDAIISNNQKIIAGLSTATLGGSNQLNYRNSILGGYKLNVTMSDSGSTDASGNTIYNLESLSYGTSMVSANKWKYQNINAEFLTKALAYIYLHEKPVTNPDNDVSFASDIETNLRSYYSGLNLSEVNSVNLSEITYLGLSRDYLWNVCYFVAYSLIGQTNIENSINNHNKIFVSEAFTPLSDGHVNEDLVNAFQNYKGYHIITREMCTNMFNLCVSSDSLIGYSNYFNQDESTGSWEKTLFPKLTNNQYIFYDKIEELSDAKNDINFPEDTDDGEFDPDAEFDEDSFDEEKFDFVPEGSAFKLKQVILLPFINSEKYKGNDFKFGGVLVGFRSADGNTYQVGMNVDTIFNDGIEINNSALIMESEEIVDNRVVFDGEYKLSQDLTDAAFDENGTFKNIELKDDSSDIGELISNSFTTQIKSKNYIDGTNKDYAIGILNVYNQLFLGSGELNLGKNRIIISFDYRNSNGSAVGAIPATNLMYFYVYD